MQGPKLPIPDAMGGALKSMAQDLKQDFSQLPKQMGESAVKQVTGNDQEGSPVIEQGVSSTSGNNQQGNNVDYGVSPEEKNPEREIQLKRIRQKLQQFDLELKRRREEREQQLYEKERQEDEEKQVIEQQKLQIQQKRRKWNVVDQLRQEFGGSGEVSGVRKH